jgi:uncharacterized membrane protein YphA (DoxX/SURF4 family)
MTIAMIVVSTLLAIAVVASATAKLRQVPAVVDSMRHVGVSPSQIRLLAVLEVAGGVGLLAGLASALVGRLAAAGLVLYFLGAVGAHLRVKDRVQEMTPAAVLLLVAVATLVLQGRR